MPLSNEGELDDVRRRLNYMLVDTIETFQLIEKNTDTLFGDRADEIRAAIAECLNDFWRNTSASGERHPEGLIFQCPRENLQQAGFYGAQLAVKERQVRNANHSLRERLVGGARGFFKKPFRKWVDIINNFLGSLGKATGWGEALKELKDLLRDELPDEDDK